MHASTLSFRFAVILAIAGMIMGIVMAASGNHSVYPAHASRIALVQVGIWIFGTIVLTCGVVAIFLGHPEYEPLAIGGSLIVLADMLLFAFLVVRPERSTTNVMRSAPAE
jgi:hypothetical protein